MPLSGHCDCPLNVFTRKRSPWPSMSNVINTPRDRREPLVQTSPPSSGNCAKGFALGPDWTPMQTPSRPRMGTGLHRVVHDDHSGACWWERTVVGMPPKEA